MNDVEKVRRAEQAKAILESPVWNEAWDAYRQRLIDIWIATKMSETGMREEAKRMQVTLDAVKAHFVAIINDGKMSAAQIKLDEERKKFNLWKR